VTSISRFTRRAILCSALPLLAAPAFAADAWPSRPIKLVVGFPAGGPTDVAARILAKELGERLKQPVVVDNKAGASGSIAAAQVAKTEGDGYTFMMLATPTLLAPHMYKKVAFDTSKDFMPVASVYDLPIVMVVNPTMMPDVTDVPKLIAHAKAHPGAISYTSSGVGSFGHLSMELLKQLGGFDMQHIAYKGSAPAVTDTIGGQVPVMYSDLIAPLPHIRSGKLRAIAVGSPQRVSVVPDVKTVAEQGFKGFDAVSWGGLLAPLGTPPDIVARVSKEVSAVLADKQVQEQLVKVGAIANYMPPEKFAVRIKTDSDKWGKVIRDKGLNEQ
jgi:tripartite-type tricarboxylate transporter receptor subunit TctC